MNDITCNVCMDLMPLVKDNIASNDSRLLVERHIGHCEYCAEIWGEEVEFDAKIDNKIIVGKIRKQLNLIAILIISLSILFGVSLAVGQNMFFNIILMPSIGAVSYIFLKNKAFFIVLFVLIVACLWHIIILYSQYNGMLTGGFASLWWGIIYAALCGIGVIVAFLLHFAFKKEVSK